MEDNHIICKICRKGIPSVFRKKYTNQFIELYNMFAHRVNDAITYSLNNIWDSMDHDDIKNYDPNESLYDNDDAMLAYNRFMAIGYNMIVDEINKKHPEYKVALAVDNDTAEIYGYWKIRPKKSKIYITD